MNPLRWLWDIARFLYDDIKTDIKALIEITKRIRKGEKVFDAEAIKKDFEGYSVYKFLADYWLFFLMLAFAFISGWWVASQHYQDMCNTWIIENLFEAGKCSIGPSRNWNNFTYLVQ